MSAPCRLGVLGATGAVGSEVLRILGERHHPGDCVVAFGSERSQGQQLDSPLGELLVQAFSQEACESLDALILAADADTARAVAPIAIEAGLRVVDNSSAFRLDPDVPLVVPELRSGTDAEWTEQKLFANPNCSTILAAVVLAPLREAFGLEAVSLSTYQAVSGAGREAVDALFAESRSQLDGAAPSPTVFPSPCAFNVFPHESDIDPETLANEEERKIVRELRRLFEDDSLPIDPCCVRVPVERAHSQSLRLTLRNPVRTEDLEAVLARAPGVRLETGHPPTPLDAADQDAVLVGRVRATLDARSERGRTQTFRLWLCGDQLRKGAALNALQTLEALGLRFGS